MKSKTDIFTTTSKDLSSTSFNKIAFNENNVSLTFHVYAWRRMITQ